MKKLPAVAILLALVVYGAYEGLIYFDNNFPYGRMRETPAVKPHEQEILPMAKGTVPFDGGERLFRAVKGKDLKSPLPKGHAPEIAQGEKLYSTYCAQCHGKYFDGNGTVGQSFHPLPGDLRSRKVQSMADGLIFEEISYGIPGGRQPPLATTIAPLDRWRIIAYLKTLGPRD
jgi:hypothetical protein